MLQPFEALRYVLSNMCLLHVPVEGDVFSIDTDASAGGVGAVLNVVRDGVFLPVAFYSHQLWAAEKRYSATELEALAIVCAVAHLAFPVRS